MGVWKVQSGAELAKLDDGDLLEGLLDAWPNKFLAPYRGKRPLPANIAKVMQTVREQYSSPCMPCGSAELDAILGAKLSAPILAVACTQELPAGETAEKMRGWAELTTSSFELKEVDADHMGC